jgi:hypothetical protein
MKVNVAHERRVPMEPPIALERPVKKELEKGDYLTYKLRNDPADPQSPGYELTIPYFRDGTPEQFLRFKKNLNKVFNGQNVTDGPGMFTIGRRLMDGDALSHFENFVTAEALTQTVNNFNKAMEAVGRHVFPAQAAKLQKRYLRRFVRKPIGMTSRMFVARVQELNNYLPFFPEQVPGEPIQKLDDDEIIDLMEFGVPRSWQKKMEEHSFDSTNTTIGEFLAFCERMERIEQMDTAKSGGGGRPDQGGGRAGKTDVGRKRKADVADHKSHHKGGDKNYYCLYHGENGTHSTDNCYLMKKEVRLMKDRPMSMDVPRKKEYAKKQDLNAFTKTKSNGQRESKKSRKDPKAEHIEELKNFEELSLSDVSTADVAFKAESESDDDDSTN